MRNVKLKPSLQMSRLTDKYSLDSLKSVIIGAAPLSVS